MQSAALSPAGGGGAKRDTSVSYKGIFDNHGAYISDPSSNNFNNLYIGANGYLSGGDSDLFSIAGDFLNYSTNSLWDTVGADLAFTSAVAHNFFLGEAGQSFIWDDLTLYGMMHLTGDAYLYADELLGLDLASFTLTGNGRIFFDALNANNAYLLDYTHGYTYLAASYEGVPEPGARYGRTIPWKGSCGKFGEEQKSWEHFRTDNPL